MKGFTPLLFYVRQGTFDSLRIQCPTTERGRGGCLEVDITASLRDSVESVGRNVGNGALKEEWISLHAGIHGWRLGVRSQPDRDWRVNFSTLGRDLSKFCSDEDR